MEKVKAEVVTHYRSALIEHIRANNCTFAHGSTGIRLAKEFGFCYGVERAIDLAYAARRHFPKEQPVYILGEIIHNPHVNEQIRDMGVTFLSGSHKAADIDDLGEGDPVVIPAFGTEVKVNEMLKARGCTVIDATCGDVMSVWKRVRQNTREQVTSIIHGKAWHEETKATSSQAKAFGSGHYLVVFDLDETDYVCRYITQGGDRAAFLKKFEGATSDGFDPDKHLDAIGLANQTTMLRGETEEVQRRLRAAGGSAFQRYGPPAHCVNMPEMCTGDCGHCCYHCAESDHCYDDWDCHDDYKDMCQWPAARMLDATRRG